jgi:hypothetical protein
MDEQSKELSHELVDEFGPLAVNHMIDALEVLPRIPLLKIPFSTKRFITVITVLKLKSRSPSNAFNFNTVMTVMNRLVEKGILSKGIRGRTSLYRPVCSKRSIKIGSATSRASII